jgi:Fe-S-cluster containining protein
MSPNESPWYRNGLSFECTRCGACCTGTPGYVWVSLEEITRMAEHLELSLESFGQAYLRRVGDQISLIEKPNNDCIFWDSAVGCTIYEVRPDQCQTWPFWTENVETPADWERTRQACPGSGQGRVYGVEEIVSILNRSPL